MIYCVRRRLGGSVRLSATDEAVGKVFAAMADISAAYWASQNLFLSSSRLWISVCSTGVTST
jgi:hypothetical protein